MAAIRSFLYTAVIRSFLYTVAIRSFLHAAAIRSFLYMLAIRSFCPRGGGSISLAFVVVATAASFLGWPSRPRRP